MIGASCMIVKFITKRALALLLLLLLLLSCLTGCDLDAANNSEDDENSSSLELVTHPTEAYIIACLEVTPNVIEIAAVDEAHDPNGKLNADGGYYAAVFFAVDLIDQDSIFGDSLLEGKGTDAGGCIEAYQTIEDAEARDEYLSGFDDRVIFNSGYHTVIGTLVVRTSKKLSEDEQKQLESNIISVLTGGEVEEPTPSPSPTLGANQVQVPLASSEYVGKGYEEVVGSLTALGFTNIKTEPSYDIYLGLTKEKALKSISINGNSSFQSGHIFDKDAEVTIIYRMPYTDDPSYIKMPHESEYYDGMNYLEVEQQLKALGFTNIDLDEMPSSYYEDGEVFSVLKGNHPFDEGDAIKNDEKITINYYVAEKPVVLETLTIDNNDQFAALMKITDQTDATTIRAFVNAHIGDIIEFDGCVAFMMNHGDYKTRFDICTVGGDYDNDKVYGPLFAFENVSFSDMNVSGTDTVAEGMDFHITAKIEGYSSAGQYIILRPVSMKVR